MLVVFPVSTLQKQFSGQGFQQIYSARFWLNRIYFDGAKKGKEEKKQARIADRRLKNVKV